MSEIEEMEDYLHDELFSGKPRSVGEAVGEVEEQERAPGEETPITVPDEPPAPGEPGQEPSPVPAELPVEPERREGEDEEEGEGEGPPLDEGIAWAKRKYGDDTTKWARAAYEQERHISQLAREKRESDELASQWYEYAQQVEQQAQQQVGSALPLSAQEEQWIENSLSNPVEFARQAAYSGRVQLYNGVIGRVAEENPGLAAQIGTQVQMELAQAAQAEQPAEQVSLADALGGSFQRLGLNLEAEGPRMATKLGELGEYHPYVRAIMGPDDAARDLAVQAVHDLARATTFTPRQVQREANLAQENEMRRDAASVQTGGITPPAPPKADSAFMAGMQEEWERRGQWQKDE